MLTSIKSRIAKETALSEALLSHFGANALNAILSVLLTPIYVKYLGPEAYGIIGFYNAVSAFFFISDFGAGATVNRELARLFPEKMDLARKMIRSLEVLLLLGVTLASPIMIAFSYGAAFYWVNPKTYSRLDVFECFLLMSVSLIFNIIIGFYINALLGTGRQLLSNILSSLVSLLRYIGAVPVLLISQDKIKAFLLWQALMAFLQSFLLLVSLWKLVSDFYVSKPDINLLRSIYRFTTGVTIAGLLGLLVINVDKGVLSRILDLEHFGYYSFSAGIIMTIFLPLINPVYRSIYPVFSRLISRGDSIALENTYHKVVQILSLIVIPSCFFLCLFCESLLRLWLRQDDFVSNVVSTLPLLCIAYVFTVTKLPPHCLRIAHGWTRLDVYENLILVITLTTALACSSYYYGLKGALWALVVINLIDCITVVYFTHKVILRGSYSRWLLVDNGVPFVISFIVMFVGKYMLAPLKLGNWIESTIGVLLLFLAMSFSLLGLRELRDYVFHNLAGKVLHFINLKIGKVKVD
jgi:O-antigen/teichoic acid export membrane protein